MLFLISCESLTITALNCVIFGEQKKEVLLGKIRTHLNGLHRTLSGYFCPSLVIFAIFVDDS